MDYRPDANALVAAFAAADFTRDEDSWNEAVQQDKAPDPLDVPEPDEDGNYHTPFQKRVIDLFEQLEEGKVDKDYVGSVLDKGLSYFENILSELQLFVEMGIDDPNNLLQQAFKAGFEEHKAVVEKLKRYLLNDDEKLLQEGMIELQQATNRSMDAYAFFQRLRNVAMTVICPHCEAENKRGNAKCEKCKNPLPTAEEKKEGALLAVAAEGVLQADSTAPLTTPNFQKVEAALQAWEAQELEDDQLLEVIDEIEGNMASHREANQAEREDMDGLTEEEEKVMTTLLDGVDAALDSNLQALSRMKQYWEDNDPDHLRIGFQMLAAATQQIIEAYLASQNLMNQAGDEEGATE